MQSHQIRVNTFMTQAGQLPKGPNWVAPHIPSEEVRLLRAKLILEEALETIEALGFFVKVMHTDSTFLFEANDRGCDIIQVADGCADLSVVTVGTLSAFGIRAEPIVQAVDLANLAKFTGDAHRREDGKWIKPSDWQAPDLMKLLVAQGYKEPENGE